MGSQHCRPLRIVVVEDLVVLAAWAAMAFHEGLIWRLSLIMR
jgi:hypothetical protein